ncbi:MAG: hypothetical protein IPK58_06890 [Acidobacteria bacterium]|nr:hypothetical protein [Acidobacteriota bacterium]
MRFSIFDLRLGFQIPDSDSRFQIPDSRFQIPDSRYSRYSRFPIRDSRFQIPGLWKVQSAECGVQSAESVWTSHYALCTISLSTIPKSQNRKLQIAIRK